MSEHFVYGLHAATALLANPERQIYKVFINQERQDQRLQEIIQLVVARQIPLEKLTSHHIQQRFGSFTHQGIVLSVKPLPTYQESDLVTLLGKSKSPCLILILDGITDPHNLGACLRSADASGVDFVIIPKDQNASLTEVVSKVACGATESLPIMRITNLARTIDALKKEGVWVYGAAGEASTRLYDLDCRVPIAIIMGAEGKGLRRLTRERCDQLFCLPMFGTVSSLNVSVATGISLYEVVRQRGM